MKTYLVTSDCWARDPVTMTFEEIEELAATFNRDRTPDEPACTVSVDRFGNVTDETGEVIAEEVKS